MKDVLNLSGKLAASVPNRSYVVAQGAHIDAVDDRIDQMGVALRWVPTDADAPVSPEVLQKAELLVVEFSGDDDAGVRRIAEIRRERPDVPIIAAVGRAELPLMRALLRYDVHDVIALPFDPNELIEQIYETGLKLTGTSETSLSPVVCIAGVSGGVGASSIALGLADSLCDNFEHSARCCLIDLNLQFGDLASHAGVSPARSIADLLEAGPRLDQDMLRNVVAKASSCVHVLSAPSEIIPLEMVDVDQLLSIVTLARREYDAVIVDLPQAWTNWSLSVAATSDEILLVTGQDLSHLRKARRCVDMFDDVGIERRRVKGVVNRVTRKMFQSISVQDVADTLQREIVGSIAQDRGELTKAIEQGKPLHDMNRKASFVKDVDGIADGVYDRVFGDER